MDKQGFSVQSQITFLYYQDLQAATLFYGDIVGLEMVEDQAWARIYRVSGNAFLGIVAGEKGFHRPQERSAVLVTLVVDDVPGWYERLKSQGVKLLSDLEHREEIQIRCFFFEDPGGYTLEVQQFLKPNLTGIFHKGA
ncbi:MAG: VOC family protein [Anaerolineae bacterium]|nr:VOC family protein [Anaerolineae bacterium]